jgi:hypothetical protein
MEVTLVTGRALGIGSALIFGIASLVLLLGALILGQVAFYTGSAAVADVVSKMSVTGGDSLVVAVLGVGLTFLTLWLLGGLADHREIAEYERERAERAREQWEEKVASRRGATL